MLEKKLIDGIDVLVEGAGEQSIVMLHGWPDTYRVWDAQVAAFQSKYRCVRFTLPGFDIDKPRRAYSLDETMDIFANIIQKTCPGQKVILLVHDWGAVFGYQFCMRHPELVSRLIGVDIGDASSAEFLESLPTKAKLMVAGYQGWLSLAWRVGGRVGDAMTTSIARAMKCRSEPRYISSAMNYPYFIKRTGAYGSYQEALPVSPACPMLFIYGTKKPFMFHSPQWLRQLASQPGSKVLGMATDHWPMRSAADEFNQEVLGFLSATATAAVQN
jgi:pimeloyl-ACP methyl ester carboxylesterase